MLLSTIILTNDILSNILVSNIFVEQKAMSANVSAYLFKRDFMRVIMITLMLAAVTQAGALFPSKLHAGSHALELSLESCNYVKAFAKLVLEKRSFAVPLSFYESINFNSPAAMEIVFEAYEVDLATSVTEQQDAAFKFSEKWFQHCIEISCSGFWSDLETSLEKISKD
jgi:hypothetical protein